MKNKIKIIISIALSFLFLPFFVHGQTASLWTVGSSKVKPVVTSWGLLIPSTTTPSFIATTTTIGTQIPTWQTATSTYGGTLASSTTYYYKIVAHTIDGVTLPSAQIATTTNANGFYANTIELSWQIYPGASSFDIYRSATSNVFGATSFLTNVSAINAYENWAQGFAVQPERDIYDDNGSIALTSGTPPTVNGAYLNEFGSQNHTTGDLMYEQPVTIKGQNATVTSYLGSGPEGTTTLRANFVACSGKELADQGDCQIFWVGQDTMGIAGPTGGLPVGLVWQQADLGNNQFGFVDSNGKYTNIQVGTMNGNSFNSQLAGNYSNPEFRLNDGAGVYSYNPPPGIDARTIGMGFSALGTPAGFFGKYGFGLSGTNGEADYAKGQRLSVVPWGPTITSGGASISGHVVTGVSTQFLSEYSVGDEIQISGTAYDITAVTDNTHMTIRQSASVMQTSPFRIESIFALYDNNDNYKMFMDPLGNIIIGNDPNTNTGQQLQVGGTSIFGSIATFNGNIVVGNGNSVTLTDQNNFVIGATSGTKFGTANTQKLSFWGATTITQPTNTVAQDAVLTTTGLQASGGTPWYTSTLGIATSTPWKTFSVNGNEVLTGSLFDSTSNAGTSGNILMSTNTGTQWVSTSTAYANLPKVTTYNSTTTAGLGLPVIYNVVSLTNQTSDVTATGFTKGNTAGLYRLEYSLEDTVSDIAAGTVTMTIAYTDDAGSATQTVSQVLTGTGRTQGTIFIQLASGQITYATSHTGLFGSAKYALYITLERLN